MARDRVHFAFLNLGHFFDHLLLLVFATVAALTLTREWGMTYAELILYATPALIAFGLCALPAGWLADRWSREGMMLVFFLGMGASACATSFASTPIEIAMGLFAIGVFGAIYHPVGLALVIQGRERTGVPLAVNGVFGNLGVACAALFSGLLVDHSGWQAAFIWPGVATFIIGIGYAGFLYLGSSHSLTQEPDAVKKKQAGQVKVDSGMFKRILSIVFFSTALGGLIFQSTTFALPKVIDEVLAGIAVSASAVGWYAFVVFAAASVGQLIVGFLVDRWSLKWVFLVVAAFQVLFFWVMIGLSGLLALSVAVAFMLVVFGQIPINDVLIGRVTRSEWRSRVFAARYLITFSVSATAVPMIAWIHAGWGFDSLFALLAVVAAMIVFAVVLLPRALAPAA